MKDKFRALDLVLCLSPLLSLVLLSIIGKIVAWDGQGALLALPFAIYAFFASPILICIFAVRAIRNRSSIQTTFAIITAAEFLAIVIIARTPH